MSNPLTAGTLQITCQTQISGASIAPQGTSASPTLPAPTASATGTGEAVYSFGNAATGECDILCAAEYDLTGSGGSVTLDLFANGIPNIFGGTADFLHLRSVFIGIVDGGDETGITIGNAGSNPHPLFFGSTSSTWVITASGVPLQGADNAGVVVSSTARNVQIVNNSAVLVTVLVMLGGTST